MRVQHCVIHEGDVMFTQRCGCNGVRENHVTTTCFEKGADGVDPRTRQMGQRNIWSFQNRDRQARDMLPPQESGAKELLSRTLKAKMCLKRENVLDSLFNEAVGETNPT